MAGTEVWTLAVVRSLLTDLGIQRQLHIITFWISDDGLDLLHGVGGVNKLGHVEARVLDLVLALDFGDLNGLGHTDFLGSWVRKRAGDLEGGGDQRNLVSLGLVLLTTDLVFSLAVSLVTIAIASSSTGSHLHGLGLVLVGHLGGGAGGGHGLLLVHVGADLSLHDGGGLLAHCQHTVEAVVVVHDLLDGQGDGGHLVGEGGDADLSVDGGVGVPAVELGGVSVPVSRGVDISQGGGESDGEDNKSLKYESVKHGKLLSVERQLQKPARLINIAA